MKEPLLICMVGLPQSGKSTWARSQGLPIVNPDAIRLALHGEAYIPQAEPMVWVLAKYMVTALFLAGHGAVILDATNTTRKRRDDWISDNWETVFKLIDESAGVCIQRAEQSGNVALVTVIEKMKEHFEKLGGDETLWKYQW